MADKDISMEKNGNGGAAMAESSTNFQPIGDIPVTQGIVVVAPQFIDVVAPSDMPGGYQFNVDHPDGHHMVVTVPEGGVKQGVVFKAAILNDGTTGFKGHSIPVGRWRDGTFDCCNFGCCHPVFCLTLWFTPVALGQILTRMKLNWIGTPLSPETKKAAWTAFRVMAALFVGYQVLDTFLYYLVQDYVQVQYNANTGEYTYANDIPMWANIVDAMRHCLTLAYGLVILFATIRARSHIRAKYDIPEQCCTGCEDFCCGFWCGVCSICQMARHTADYRSYNAACCSETGLDPRAPEIV